MDKLRLVTFLTLIISLPGYTLAAEFIDLGDLPGGINSSDSHGISADGSTVVGVSNTSIGPTGFYWSKATGMISLPHWYVSAGSSHSQANAISADGSLIVGQTQIPTRSNPATRFLSARWHNTDQINVYSSLSGDQIATAVSADGSTVLGHAGSNNAHTFAVKFIDAGSISFGLSPNSGYQYTRVVGVTDDGSKALVRAKKVFNDVFVSYFYTFNPSGYEFLGSSDTGAHTFSLGMSSDGQYVCGEHKANAQASFNTAFLWTTTGGFVDLGSLQGGSSSSAVAVSDDGNTVVGSSFSNAGRIAFLWNPTNGMRSLQDIAENDFGLDLGGFKLIEANNISDDGNTITGYGETVSGSQHAFWLTFNNSVPALDGDLAPLGNPDGIINAADYLIAMRIVTGDLIATSLELNHGDLYPPGTPDGVIDLSDALLILKLIIND